MNSAVEKKQTIKQQKKYIINIEGFVPVSLQLETMAEDEQEALKNLDSYPSLVRIRNPPKIILQRLKRRKVTIIEAFTNLVKVIRNF